ncbi:MAG: hypothetical protein IJ427_00855 [Lachnospiraceae bacterium]|nr:hypothetical protein [Lachnospiraceae bacterium]MBQ8547018.1 hypothetical protein [Lachnospiraceae bacterium]MBQ8577401.1 hypothetical protein [Clostridia bacterium]
MKLYGYSTVVITETCMHCCKRMNTDTSDSDLFSASDRNIVPRACA